MSTNYQFTISVLKILTEERRTAHCERWDKVTQQKHFRVGDIIRYSIQVQSKVETGEVKSYLIRNKDRSKLKLF